MRLEYTRKGDYLFPNIAPVSREREKRPIGRYGRLRKEFLKENRSGEYARLLLAWEMDEHLEDIEEAAGERMESLMRSLPKSYPPPDQEKDMMGWVSHMNNLKAMAEEMVLNEIVFA